MTHHSVPRCFEVRVSLESVTYCRVLIRNCSQTIPMPVVSAQIPLQLLLLKPTCKFTIQRYQTSWRLYQAAAAAAQLNQLDTAAFPQFC